MSSVSQTEFRTSGLVRLTRPQLIGTLGGLLFALLLAAIDQTIVGMGMFGVIIYLPLFMQGVLGVSATQSGNLLTPLMTGAVIGSIVTGQMSARAGAYKLPSVAGSSSWPSG